MQLGAFVLLEGYSVQRIFQRGGVFIIILIWCGDAVVVVFHNIRLSCANILYIVIEPN